MNTTITSSNQVLLERVFDVRVDLLWRIWTEPEFVLQWFGGDPNGTVISADIDLRVGGKYKIHFADSNGSEHTAFGDFTLIETNSRLHYSWEWVSEPEQVSRIEVDFIAMGDQSKLVLLHKDLHPDSKHGYQQGWSVAMDKIENLCMKLKY